MSRPVITFRMYFTRWLASFLPRLACVASSLNPSDRLANTSSARAQSERTTHARECMTGRGVGLVVTRIRHGANTVTARRARTQSSAPALEGSPQCLATEPRDAPEQGQCGVGVTCWPARKRASCGTPPAKGTRGQGKVVAFDQRRDAVDSQPTDTTSGSQA